MGGSEEMTTMQWPKKVDQLPQPSILRRSTERIPSVQILVTSRQDPTFAGLLERVGSRTHRPGRQNKALFGLSFLRLLTVEKVNVDLYVATAPSHS